MTNSDEAKERCFAALEGLGDCANPVLEYIRLLQNTLSAHRATIAAQDRMLEHFGRKAALVKEN